MLHGKATDTLAKMTSKKGKEDKAKKEFLIEEDDVSVIIKKNSNHSLGVNLDKLLCVLITEFTKINNRDNEKTFYKVEVETIRDGRKSAAFKFKLHLPAELKKQKQKKKAQEALDIIAGLAEGKAMTGNTTSSDSQKKRPMPDFVVKDKDGNKIEHPYAEPVRIKDGKTIL